MHPDEQIEIYKKRPARYTGEILDRRIQDYTNAAGSARLSGKASLSDQATTAINLLAEGRINEEEYFQLCQNERPVSTTPSRVPEKRLKR